MQVLIVEDEFLIALELETLINDLGHEVVGIAATYESALRLAEQYAPDVVTVDLRLKAGGSGEALAERLLNDLKIRSIFVSGNLDNATQARLEAFRPYGFVGKPLSPHRLADVLAQANQAKTGC